MERGGDSFGLTLALEVVPAALFAAAVAFAASTVGLPVAVGAAAAAAAFLCAWTALRRLAPAEVMFELAPFDIEPVETVELDERLIEEEVRAAVLETDTAAEAVGSGAEELLLDDVLGGLPPDARVVRLFERQPMPTAGELQARIDRHLRTDARPAPPPDATEALHDALAALRQTLR